MIGKYRYMLELQEINVLTKTLCIWWLNMIEIYKMDGTRLFVIVMKLHVH